MTPAHCRSCALAHRTGPLCVSAHTHAACKRPDRHRSSVGMESCQRWTTGPGMQVHLVTSPGHTQDRVWAGPAALTRRAAASRRRSSTSAHAPSAPADEKTAWQRAPTARQPGAGAAAHAQHGAPRPHMQPARHRRDGRRCLPARPTHAFTVARRVTHGQQSRSWLRERMVCSEARAPCASARHGPGPLVEAADLARRAETAMQEPWARTRAPYP